MKAKTKCNAYEPPISLDLSQSGVLGQVTPQGVCGAGNVPYTVCQTGPLVNNVGSCTTGSSVGTCTPGSYVIEDPKCIQGSFALVGCKPGSAA